MKECVKCGETLEAIRKHKLICGSVSYEGELMEEYGRHRFKPYSFKELEEMRKDEEECIKQMGGFADFVDSMQSENKLFSVAENKEENG